MQLYNEINQNLILNLYDDIYDDMIYSKISVEMLHGRLGSPPGRLGLAERPATRATREPSGLRGALPQRTLARPPSCWAEAAAAHVPAGAGGHVT